MEALSKIQSELVAPKDLYNKFGNYYYRSAESILEAVKPLLAKNNAQLTVSDEVVIVGDRVYVKATATLTDGKETVSVTAYAREPSEKKGMDSSQITGATSSYARKYALNGLFLIDDSKDADTEESKNESDARAKAESSGSNTPKVQRPNYSAEQIAVMKKWTDGTFTDEELAEFRKRCLGADYADAIEDIEKEYEKRKALF
jgi:hypothetical protein